MRRLFGLLALLALLAACASTPHNAFTPAPARTAWIIAADGHRLGQASFTEAPHGVLIRLEITDRGLAPGWHGLHLHQRGDCSDFAQGFQASGAHVGMDMNHRVQHGLMNPAGPEAGDLPNLFAAPAGPYATELFSPYVTLGAAPGRASLLDADGSALIIHANPDDQTSQPIGNAGARIACAALTNLP
jgi:Cu-Zn family superoxide dismutase